MSDQASSEVPLSDAGYTSQSLDMLKTKEGQSNAVFACFGSAAQHAQHFETALADFLLIYNKLRNEGVTLADFEEKLRKKTMGTLLNDLKQIVTINDADVQERLKTALESRNFLMHHFFNEREEKLDTEQGRMEMLVELVGIGNLLESSGVTLRAMRLALLDALSPDASSLLAA